MFKSLKELLEENKIYHYQDSEIIKRWFIENDLEDIGLQMIPELATSKSQKIQKQLDYARSWIPTKVDMTAVAGIEHNVAVRLNKIVTYCMLSMDLPQAILDWARENIPKMDLPKIFFMPTISYLKDKYGIEFKDKPKWQEV